MDWSLTVSESFTPTGLKSVSVQKIIDDRKWDFVDILKIDIEGGERFLFAKEADLSYLSKIKLMVLEIHDEFNIRKPINDILADHQFGILTFGETTIAFNKRLIS